MVGNGWNPFSSHDTSDSKKTNKRHNNNNNGNNNNGKNNNGNDNNGDNDDKSNGSSLPITPLANPDATKYIITGMIALCLVGHLYLMIGPSQNWAHGSMILICFTLLHIVGAAHVLCVAWQVKEYIEIPKLMQVAHVLTMLEVIVYVFCIIFELLLVYMSEDVASMIAETFVGYLLILSMTMVPQVLMSMVFMFEYQHPEKYDLFGDGSAPKHNPNWHPDYNPAHRKPPLLNFELTNEMV